MAKGSSTLPGPAQAINGANGSTNGMNGAAAGDGHSASTMPIAIIGMSCRFPGDATNPSKLWDMLCAGKSAWSPIPKDKFNADAFFHPNPDRNGAVNVRGGHFLKDDIGLFDASFFNISPNEAKAIDPQQRLQLESAYEALENAGIPMENVVGSDTSVYVGVFNRDYSEMLARDPETGPVYQATGNGQAILSNRISYFFDLKGPSITLDTACSASLTALHLACQSLRTGESKMSIVGGTNMILSPDIMIAMSLLRFLSEDGRCYTYDHRASGYARGEGVASVILKPLDDALRDGDPIRAVIRQSVVNQDGRTAGITLPSRDAQEQLIRSAYKSACIDPATAGYFEAHGTGTSAGDPLEAGAIASVLCNARSSDNPIVVGSVKTNVGHLEGASGLAGLIKTVLILEHGIIPPNLNFEKQNERIPLEEWKIKIPLECQPWAKPGLRRASVNSFGYGGTNAHVIVDDAHNFLKEYRGLEYRRLAFAGSGAGNGHTSNGNNGVSEHDTNGHVANGHVDHVLSVIDGSHLNGNGGTNGNANGPIYDSARRRTFFLSANDEASGKAYAALLAGYIRTQRKVSNHLLDDLAFTLARRRSKLPWRTAIAASTAEELISSLADGDSKFARTSRVPKLGFVFTGQGAQWFAMGRELLDAYPLFHEKIVEADQTLKELGATWSLMDELLRDEQNSRVDAPYISQPICTAIQIALVDLLASWGVTASSVTGHSSGEIAAAYAVGALTFASALKVAYFRGLLSSTIPERSEKTGSMLAVGLGREEVEERISKFVNTGKAVVACINSPSSVTVSGDADAVDQLFDALKAEGVFARKLRVQVAYHSHHMQAIAEEYETALEGLKAKSTSETQFFSSVTGELLLDTTELGAAYWVRNMVSPVRFSESTTAMCLSQGSKTRRRRAGTTPDVVVEIGPHSAMAGPIKQILAAAGNSSVVYTSVLARGKNAVHTTLQSVCLLISKGTAVDLDKVNFPGGRPRSVTPMTDLPPYSWNHSTVHWQESRFSTGYRFRQFPRHDLVGAPVSDFNPVEPRWRNFIRVSENPWVRDHQVTRSILYPAAGMIVMAIEAMRQMLVINGNEMPVLGYELRDVNIGKALVVPESADGVETILSMRPLNSSSKESSDVWQEFRLFSVSKQEGWSEHCRGKISYRFSTAPAVIDDGREAKMHQEALNVKLATIQASCKDTVDVQQMYDSLDTIGLSYGETFRNLTEVFGGQCKSFGTLKIADVAKVMPYNFEYPYLIHPATLDSALQVMFPALAPAGTVVENPMVPTFVDKMFVSNDISRKPGHEYKAWSEAQFEGFKNTTAAIAVVEPGPDGARPVVEISGLQCASLTEQNQLAEEPKVPKLCFTMEWDIDVDLLTPEISKDVFVGRGSDESESNIISTLDEVSFYYIQNALRQLTDADVQAMEPHHQIFHEWMTLQVRAAEAGTLTNFKPHWLTASEEHKSKTFEFARKACCEGQMVCRMGENLVRVMRKEIEPLALMLEDDLLYAVYRDSMGNERCYELMAAYIDKLAHKNPGLNILEIGAGTGGATLPVVEKLGGAHGVYPRFSRYDFTDISSGFFEKGQENFKDWAGLINFKKLDIEEDPAGQGFEEGTYDLIMAANVLHATKNMKVTMDNVRKLLKPGGKLVLMEITHRLLRMTLVFGNLPGWWLGAAEGRRQGPSLSEEEWHDVLQDTNFSGLEVCLPDYPDVSDRVYSVITSTAVDDRAAAYPQVYIVLPENSPSPAADLIADKIPSITQAPAEVVSMDNIPDVTGAICLFLSELESPVLPTISADRFSATKRVISSAKAVLWVARGGTLEGSVPEANLITGLARTVRAENHALKFVTLDMSATARSAEETADIVTRVFEYSMKDAAKNQGVDLEYSEREGRILIPRIFDDKQTNNFIARDINAPIAEFEPFSQAGRPLKLEIGVPGLLDTLRFVEDHTTLQPIGADEVDIDVRATGVNFKDVMVSMGQLVDDFLGAEVSGVVTLVGSDVTHVAVGDRVCAWTLGGYGNMIRNPGGFVQKIPDDMTFEIAASLPIVYCTAYYSLFDAGRLEKGETVLIHAAAGGVGQAAIQLAKYAGAEIFVTVGTPDKKKLIMEKYGVPEDHIFCSRDTTFAPGIMRMTGGEGVDVILNSLAGEALQESWNCISRFGRFVEIGKRDIALNSKLAMTNFIRNTSFCSVDLTVIIRHRKSLGARIMKEVMALVQQKAVQEVYPITVHSTTEIETAFRLMQAGKHTGKLVVRSDPDCMVKVLPTVRYPLKLRPDASYLLVGGLGGLGRSMGSWMASNGARNLVFLSRSGTDRNSAKECVGELRAAGIQVAVYQCDVGDAESLDAALAQCRTEMPPVKGVIHGGMVLRDSIFENMTHDDWQQTLRPKIWGTKNLCHAFSDAAYSLDFFTILSSSAGVVGNFGQGNYAASSAFQDAVAHYNATTAGGLPIVTLDLGMILSVGFVAENEHAAANLKKWGFLGITHEQFLSMVKSTVLEPRRARPRCQVMTGLGTRGMVEDSMASSDGDGDYDVPFWFYDVKFSHLLQLDRGAQGGAEDADGAVNLPAALRGAESLAAAQQVLCDALLEKMSKVLMMALEDLNSAMPMAAYGVDSLVAVELRNWIFREMKVDLPVFELLGSHSLMELCETIAKRSSLVSESLRVDVEA